MAKPSSRSERQIERARIIVELQSREKWLNEDAYWQSSKLLPDLSTHCLSARIASMALADAADAAVDGVLQEIGPKLTGMDIPNG